MGLAGPLGCAISKVSPDGAAGNAGILVGDIVVEIAGKSVKTTSGSNRYRRWTSRKPATRNHRTAW